MLQKHAVPGTALDVLEQLMTLNFLNDFRLVGGTALALYWGHRISIDIDLFTDQKIELSVLERNFYSIDNAVPQGKNPIALTYSISNVKCDFLIYPFPFKDNSNLSEGMRLASQDDIVAMKLGAIANRGAKKDFIDLYYIFEKYELPFLFELYTKKYRIQDIFPLLKSMTYFEDAENDIMPKLLLNNSLSWDKIKNTITQKVSSLL